MVFFRNRWKSHLEMMAIMGYRSWIDPGCRCEVEPRGPAERLILARVNWTRSDTWQKRCLKCVVSNWCCSFWDWNKGFSEFFWNNCFPGEETKNTTFDSQFWASSSEDIFTVIPALTNSYKTMLPYFATHIWTGFLTSVIIILLKSSDKKWLYM